MKKQNISYQRDDDEKLARSLATAGSREPAARVLVFLDRHPGATAREIEQGVNMSQLQISLIFTYMKEQGWISVQGKRGRGHHQKFFLAQPFPEFVGDCIRMMEETVKWTGERGPPGLTSRITK